MASTTGSSSSSSSAGKKRKIGDDGGLAINNPSPTESNLAINKHGRTESIAAIRAIHNKNTAKKAKKKTNQKQPIDLDSDNSDDEDMEATVVEIDDEKKAREDRDHDIRLIAKGIDKGFRLKWTKDQKDRIIASMIAYKDKAFIAAYATEMKMQEADRAQPDYHEMERRKLKVMEQQLDVIIAQTRLVNAQVELGKVELEKLRLQ